MNRTRVGVLRGGPSPEYEVSLRTGAAVMNGLPEDRFEVLDVFVDRSGSWHVYGVPVTLPQLSRRVDVVFNAMHGSYGEDGTVQRELERYGIPYTGSRVAPSVMAMDKARSKEIFRRNDIKTPLFLVVSGSALESELRDVFRTFPSPYVVKPVRGGSSVGVTIAHSFADLLDAVSVAGEYGERVLIEECIRGREATCGVVEGLRREELYALPVIEIVPPSGNVFFDYDAKYSGETQEIVPGNFTDSEKREIQELARQVHQALGLSHYSRTDIIVSSRGIYVLETNTLPGLTEESLLPKSVDAVGMSFPDFLTHLLELALKK